MQVGQKWKGKGNILRRKREGKVGKGKETGISAGGNRMGGSVKERRKKRGYSLKGSTQDDCEREGPEATTKSARQRRKKNRLLSCSRA